MVAVEATVVVVDMAEGPSTVGVTSAGVVMAGVAASAMAVASTE